MSELVKIRTMNVSYMLPIKITIGYLQVFADRIEIDKEYFYAWVGNHIIFACHFMDIEEFEFERCV